LAVYVQLPSLFVYVVYSLSIKCYYGFVLYEHVIIITFQDIAVLVHTRFSTIILSFIVHQEPHS